jgi:hypothetical protein
MRTRVLACGLAVSVVVAGAGINSRRAQRDSRDSARAAHASIPTATAPPPARRRAARVCGTDPWSDVVSTVSPRFAAASHRHLQVVVLRCPDATSAGYASLARVIDTDDDRRIVAMLVTRRSDGTW